MPPRKERVGSRTTTKPTMDLEAHSLNPNARRDQKEALYDRVAQRLIDVLTQQPEKKFQIEKLKALGATKFNGTTNPDEAEKWSRTLEKCF
ncbi:hypothetical protein E5676_scaffold127G001250 [Cucumis melo var. makuwa]|uniref:Uncharacterized protein n=1 Tax=Cucumis melo var. makuwa TaxID=1194695 RepID=A0A5D3CDA4_CUCMM|nr:hypothetical protein E6C27_scaffold36G00200 [Cucumis melo var. makuwa]TYK09821.1 hypothetical protein E5676_scaffold127G001250 [Cucumis melo var. makuwa]